MQSVSKNFIISKSLLESHIDLEHFDFYNLRDLIATRNKYIESFRHLDYNNKQTVFESISYINKVILNLLKITNVEMIDVYLDIEQDLIDNKYINEYKKLIL